MVIDELQKRYKFTINEETNKILVKPLSKYSFQTSNVDETFIEITSEEFIGLVYHLYRFNKDRTQVILRTHDESELEEDNEEEVLEEVESNELEVQEWKKL